MNKSMDPILKAVSAILKDERKLTLEQIDGARTELLDMIAEVQKVEGPKGERGDKAKTRIRKRSSSGSRNSPTSGSASEARRGSRKDADPSEVAMHLKADDGFRGSLGGPKVVRARTLTSRLSRACDVGRRLP